MSCPTLVEIDRLLATARFRHFAELCWPAVSADRFVPGYHLDAICDHLQAVAEGKINRLAINVAVRHSKSLLCSVLFPAWLWTRAPSARVITASYSQALTVRDSVRSRALLESDLYRTHFPPVQFTDDGNRKDFYSNTSKGHRLSVSVTSRTAGFDADYIVADDLHDFATRTSQAERDKAAEYFLTGLMSRFADKADERAVLAGHRVHEDDVFARLRGRYGDDGTWSWLVLPEEYTPTFSPWFNGLGWRDRRAEGELLWPERFPADVVAAEKKRYRHEYSAVFSQEPTPADGTLFRAEWFREWAEGAEGDTPVYVLGGKRYPKATAWRFATCDTAISTTPGADWTVCQVWDVVGPHLLLVDQLRRKLDGSKIVPALAGFVGAHAPQFLAVEKQFVGQFVIDQLRQLNVPVRAFDVQRYGQKEQRAVSAEIKLEAGHVWFPPGREFVTDLQRELLGFPHAAHDDQVDALSMAGILAQKYHGKVAEVETDEQRAARAKKEAEDRFNRLLWQGCRW
ncbi:MAG TPA: phage terminase large subunit [Urbifossiella sp.]|nr:phage terminase large subunit [Urbifossiella sp.]